MQLQSAIGPKVLLGISLLLVVPALAVMGANAHPGPPAEEQQLSQAMHAKMEVLPTIRVGLHDADIVGSADRSLQAAVDYIAGLGGGVVEIGEGEFLMHDSLHLRSFVTVRGTKGKTILRKAGSVSSPLVLDGDYGEEQVTVASPEGFKVGYGITVWDSWHLRQQVAARSNLQLALNFPAQSRDGTRGNPAHRREPLLSKRSRRGVFGRGLGSWNHDEILGHAT
jgi:hypothetical protein